MPHQTKLVDALHDFGLDVIEYDGWRTRGSSYFNPRGVVVHHTGRWSTISGIVQLCIHGRSDLRGPLANVCLGPDGAVHLIAAGRANHAGPGGWRGLSGNSSVFGIEAIHDGSPSTPWPVAQLEAYPRVVAAMLKAVGAPADNCCAHREWTPRKPDPVNIDMTKFRQSVAAALAPPPPEPPKGVVVVNRPPIAMLQHPNGYWVVTDDGGVFSFKREHAPGDVPFHGSAGGIALNSPIVDAAVTPDYGGYWLVAADGGVFSFGNAKFFGSTGETKLNKPIVSITAAPDGQGYGLMAADGGVFAYGSYGYAGRVQYNG